MKDVDGLTRSRSSENAAVEIIDEMTVEQLAAQGGGVDGYLSNFLKRTRLETWVISGLKPERVSELMDSGATTGTRIIPPGD